MSLHPIDDRLVRGELILLDGALGTELERRGVATPLPLWSAQALLDAPDTLREVHADYVRAGADVLATATFRTTPRVMRKTGRPASEADRLTESAVRIAAEARDRARPDRPVWIGGSIGPLEDCYRPEDVPSRVELEREHKDQALRLKRAGAELLLLETMNDAGEAAIAAEAARDTGLPFFVSFICKNGTELLSGQPLSDAVRRLEAFAPLAVLVNCTPLFDSARCLETMIRVASGPIGCYPNAGAVGDGGAWSFDPAMTPERFASSASEWIRIGAQVLGGCCGTTPEHIRALREALPPVLVE
jgi:S-methylmethionine-dependent homocysteine/selenocysteine methylase